MLHVHGISKLYANGVKALDNVSFSAGTGLFGLLGPNGAGKSSLMRTLATLQQPDAGSIRFGEIDALSNPPALRATLGFLPQDFGVYPGVAAGEMLDHFAVLKGIDTAARRRVIVADLLELTNLTDHRNRAVSQFSGGMRRRFGIAQALIGDPKLIIVDEPTAGLDPAERHRFHNLLYAMGADRTVVLSTHIVEDIADLCPEIAVLAAGRIVTQGSPDTLVDSLKGQIWRREVALGETAGFAGHRIISERVTRGRKMVHVLSKSDPGPGFESIEPDLEDVFFALVGSGAEPGAFSA